MFFDARPPRPMNALKVDAKDIEDFLLRLDPASSGSYGTWGRDEYSRAFTAAQTSGYGVVEDLYYSLVDVVGSGGTEVDFAAQVTPILKAKGWLGGDDGRIATRVALIYDTNLRIARAAGKWANIQATKAALPYLRAFTVGDDRVRHPPKSKSDHTAWQGIILPVDHPFWLRWFPPLGFRCRCGIMQLSRSQLARYRGGITSETELAQREARLGVPVFRSPAMPIDYQLSDMVRDANAQAIPGMAPISPYETREAGSSLWDMVLADRAFQQIEDFIERLFGKAA